MVWVGVVELDIAAGAGRTALGDVGTAERGLEMFDIMVGEGGGWPLTDTGLS